MVPIIIAGIGVVLIVGTVAAIRRRWRSDSGSEPPRAANPPNPAESNAHQRSGSSETPVEPLDPQPAHPVVSEGAQRLERQPAIKSKSHFDPPRHAIIEDIERWPILATRNEPDRAQGATVEAICLVSCVGAKRATSARAKDLYQSGWFIKARAYAELVGSCWFILSAKYGLVRADEVIEPYEMTLNTMGVAERQKWARLVQRQMDERMPDADRIVVLAGQRYREFLMAYLRRRAQKVDVPMEGMRIGEQLSWLIKQAEHGPAR